MGWGMTEVDVVERIVANLRQEDGEERVNRRGSRGKCEDGRRWELPDRWRRCERRKKK